MIEALRLGIGLIALGGLLFGAAYVVRSLTRKTIPQAEIDAEARRLIVAHGEGAVEAAKMTVQRAQWAKGKSDSQERAARVLKAVRQLVGIHG